MSDQINGIIVHPSKERLTKIFDVVSADKTRVYEIDMVRMIQINNQTKRERKIRFY